MFVKSPTPTPSDTLTFFRRYAIFFCLVEFSKAMGSITQLVDEVRNLPTEQRSMFETMFRIWTYAGELRVPSTFRQKVKDYYGEKGESEEKAIERISSQTIVKTFNRWTREAALYNELRAGRPGQKTKESVEKKEELFARIKNAEKDCDFCNPETFTPEDLFGRIEGKHCITAANIAKYDAYNGVIIFGHHNPLEFNEEQLSDYIDVGLEWCKKVYEYDREFKYPFFMWNCLEKAGASRIHGHAHALITRDMPYAKVLALSHASERYGRETGHDYFDVLYSVHESVGLAIVYRQIRLLTYLTPVKEKEIMMISSSINDALKLIIFKVLRSFIDELGVVSFNLSIAMPPIGGIEDEFPIITRIVDRGDISKLASDFGGMELYGSNIIASDPYAVFQVIKNSIKST